MIPYFSYTTPTQIGNEQYGRISGKNQKRKRQGVNVPLSIVGEVDISQNGLYLIMTTKTVDNFTKVLYKYLSQTINYSSNGFPIPIINDNIIVMEQLL